MAEIGYGLTLSVSDVFPAATPVNTIGSITSFTPPAPTRDIIDVTSASSPDMAREFIAGLIDYGEAGFELNFEPGDSADTLLRSIALERKPRTWRASYSQFTPAKTITFTAFLTAYQPSSPFDDKMTASVTLKVTGSPAYS